MKKYLFFATFTFLLFNCSKFSIEKGEWRDITPLKRLKSAMIRTGGNLGSIPSNILTYHQIEFNFKNNDELLITSYRNNFRTKEKSNLLESENKFQIIDENKFKIFDIQIDSGIRIPEQILNIKKAKDVKYLVYLFDLKVTENGEETVHTFMNTKYKYKEKDLMKF